MPRAGRSGAVSYRFGRPAWPLGLLLSSTHRDTGLWRTCRRPVAAAAATGSVGRHGRPRTRGGLCGHPHPSRAAVPAPTDGPRPRWKPADAPPPALQCPAEAGSRGRSTVARRRAHAAGAPRSHSVIRSSRSPHCVPAAFRVGCWRLCGGRGGGDCLDSIGGMVLSCSVAVVVDGVAVGVDGHPGVSTEKARVSWLRGVWADYSESHLSSFQETVYGGGISVSHFSPIPSMSRPVINSETVSEPSTQPDKVDRPMGS